MKGNVGECWGMIGDVGECWRMGKNNVKNTLQKAINLPHSTTCV